MLNNNAESILINLSFQTGGYFRFIDGWHMALSKWASGEPRGNQPCVYLDIDGAWKTADCHQKMNSVCMKSTGRACVNIKKNVCIITLNAHMLQCILLLSMRNTVLLLLLLLTTSKCICLVVPSISFSTILSNANIWTKCWIWKHEINW